MYDKDDYANKRFDYQERRAKYRAKRMKQFNFEVPKEWYQVVVNYCDEFNTSHGYKKPAKGKEAESLYLTPKNLVITAIETYCKQNGFMGFEEYHATPIEYADAVDIAHDYFTNNKIWGTHTYAGVDELRETETDWLFSSKCTEAQPDVKYLRVDKVTYLEDVFDMTVQENIDTWNNAKKRF